METMEIRKKRRICLVVAYDGTNYQGWQIQQNGNTIEAELNRALSALTKEPIEVSGASRTDSGVHARCNYAVFDTAVRMPGDKFSYALNQRVPEDIQLIGFDDVMISTVTTPQITTIHQPVEEMTELCVEYIAKSLKNESVPQKIVLPVRLVQRGTTVLKTEI